ncbi:MAG TPA: ribosome small subunit-dependent GTPase A [Planctomycetes bacterium]|nr:ribosome small subunit-dependent GTPase A [Planctomycetaceae bacterium]HIM31380.1 ribosome small subunit-dependent GTPase A [Planctomycetota bacterium]
MAKKKQKGRKIRTEFRKKYETRTRDKDLTKVYQGDEEVEDLDQTQRVSGKGEFTRKRTIIGEVVEGDETGFAVQLSIDESLCLKGRVLSVHGRDSHVAGEDGKLYRCAIRRLLKSLATEQRHVVAAGDRVLIRPGTGDQAWIERIEPRTGVISRTSRQRRHVIVANVDQLLIVSSAAEPVLKPNLIDRFLITAEKCGIQPVICINKVDLVDPAALQPIVGTYAQIGYRVLLVSAENGKGIEELQEVVFGKQSAVAGQSGVGKSTLLNLIEPGLELRVRTVSSENQKGRHTTTAAQLIPLARGGYVVDTPGIRQFQLWDVAPAELAQFMPDVRPYVSHCRYPDCTHRHEDSCAVKDAVADGWMDPRRYESYCHLFES